MEIGEDDDFEDGHLMWILIFFPICGLRCFMEHGVDVSEVVFEMQEFEEFGECCGLHEIDEDDDE